MGENFNEENNLNIQLSVPYFTPNFSFFLQALMTLFFKNLLQTNTPMRYLWTLVLNV